MDQPRLLSVETTPEIFARWLASQTRTLEHVWSTEDGGCILIIPFSSSDMRQVWDNQTDARPIHTEMEICGVYYPDENEIQNLPFEKFLPQRAYRAERRTKHDFLHMTFIRIVLVPLNEKNLQAQAWCLSPYAMPYFDALWKSAESSYRVSSTATNSVDATSDVKPDTEHAPAKPESPAEQYLFSKQGEIWIMAFRTGKPFQVKYIKGFIYIVTLLRQPNNGFHILELVRSAEPAEFDNLQRQVQSMSAQDLEIEEGLNIKEGEKGMEDYDAETLRNLNERLEKIDKIIEGTEDSGKKAELEKEATLIREYLNRGKGKGGKIRTRGEMAEKERTRVAQLVDGAIGKIRKYDSAFADHLKESIKIKLANNRYLPPQPVVWQT